MDLIYDLSRWFDLRISLLPAQVDNALRTTVQQLFDRDIKQQKQHSLSLSKDIDQVGYRERRKVGYFLLLGIFDCRIWVTKVAVGIKAIHGSNRVVIHGRVRKADWCGW